jgi:hypothetical protein
VVVSGGGGYFSYKKLSVYYQKLLYPDCRYMYRFRTRFYKRLERIVHYGMIELITNENRRNRRLL